MDEYRYITRYSHNIEDVFFKLFMDIDRFHSFEENQNHPDRELVMNSHNLWIDWYMEFCNDVFHHSSLFHDIQANHKQLLEMYCHIVEHDAEHSDYKDTVTIAEEFLLGDEYELIIVYFFNIWCEAFWDYLEQEILFYRVSTRIAISKLKRNSIVNNGILLKLNMKNCGIFDE